MRKAFKFRCYPNIGARRRIYRIIKYGVTPVWNACIAEREQARNEYGRRIGALIEDKEKQLRRKPTEKEIAEIRKILNAELKKERFWPSAYSQYKHVRKSEHPEYTAFYASMLQCTANEVDAAEKSFLALWLKGDKDARPPKQQKMHGKIMFRQNGWKPLRPETGRVHLTGIGWLRFKRHRTIEGKVKAVTITQKNRKYYISFSCEIDKFSGACDPVSEAKPISGNNLRQEHNSTGGSDPKKVGAHNFEDPHKSPPFGGSDPKKVGAHNFIELAFPLSYGGSDPKKVGAHNLESFHAVSFRGGSDPKKVGAHNNRIQLDHPRTGGSDPKKVGAISIAFGFRDNIFIADSGGRIIEHPEFYIDCLDRLAMLNRRLDGRFHVHICNKCGYEHRKKQYKKFCTNCEEYSEYTKKWSNNWAKAKYTLEKFHEHLANRRKNFLWQVVRFYVDNYQTITIQEWPLKKQIEYSNDKEVTKKLVDGAYSKFVKMLKFKCGEYGRELIIIPPEEKLTAKIEKLDEQKHKIKKIKKVLKKTKTKLRKEAV